MTDLEQQLTDHLRRRAAAVTPRFDLEGVEQRGGELAVVELTTAHNRRRPSPWVAVAAVIALFVAGVALDRRGEGEPSFVAGAVDPDDQALAVKAVLTAEDVGEWEAASPEQERRRRTDEAALASCLGPDVSELRADRATARSLYVDRDNGNPEHLASTATVYSSPADAGAVLDRVRLPAVQSCYVKAIEQQVLQGARAGLTTITGRRLAVDDLEVQGSETEPSTLMHVESDGRRGTSYDDVTDDYHAFQVKTTLSAGDGSVDVYTTVAFVTEGPVAMELSVQTYFTPFERGVGLGSLAKPLLDRLP